MASDKIEHLDFLYELNPYELQQEQLNEHQTMNGLVLVTTGTLDRATARLHPLTRQRVASSLLCVWVSRGSEGSGYGAGSDTDTPVAQIRYFVTTPLPSDGHGVAYVDIRVCRTKEGVLTPYRGFTPEDAELVENMVQSLENLRQAGELPDLPSLPDLSRDCTSISGYPNPPC